MARQLVQDDADPLGQWIVQIDEIAHAVGEVAGGALVGDLDRAPGPVGVEEDEQVDRAIAAILAVVALELARRGRDRLGEPPRHPGGGLRRAHPPAPWVWGA